MTQTTHLGLPYIDPAQAQKHVTHNEALALIDALTQLSVSARDVTAPPVSPGEGDRLLIGAGATGAFAGKDLQVATFLAGDWSFLAPQPGWRAYVEAEQALLFYDGAQWRDLGLSLRSLQNLSLLGVGTTADASNPLSVKLNAALFAAKPAAESGSGDLRLTLNKESTAKTVSQLYQSNWSGRAETGLTGDDSFHVKVSADGASWKEALVINPATGLISMSFTAGVANGLASLTAAGRLPATQFPALSGDVTTAAGSLATAIAAGAVTNAKLAGAPAGTIKSNISGAAGAPADNSISAVLDSLFGATQGAIAYRGASAWASLPPGVDGQRLQTGGAATNPSWANSSANIIPFASSGTYTPSPGVKFVDVLLFGGGGGGGSGARVAASTAASGGAGGGGGKAFGRFTAAQIGASKAVTVGAGGAGGSGQTANSSNGDSGDPGGHTSFGALLRAFGGGGGAGGQIGATSGGGGGSSNLTAGASASGATGGGGSGGLGNGGSGAGSVTVTVPCFSGGGAGSPASGGAGNNGGLSFFAASGGGSGGGVTAANAVSNGGAGGLIYLGGVSFAASAGLASGAKAGGGGASWTAAAGPLEQSGAGGGGGASDLTAPGAGGAGGLGGGGGGGGGASQNGAVSGAGGAGGAGYAIVIEYF